MMTTDLTDLTDSIADLQTFAARSETLPLLPTDCDRARDLSQALRPQRQTQAYLNALALFGFATWLQKRAPEIAINADRCAREQCLVAEILNAACPVQVGAFRVCLVPTLAWSDIEVTLPRAVVEVPEFNAHFYVLVGIEEDLQVTAVLGFLRRDHLTALAADLEPQTDWTYALPRNAFNPDSDELLLDLQCLAPTAVPLPSPEPAAPLAAEVWAALGERLPATGDRPLWEVLTWAEGVALLRQPRLLQWLQRTAAAADPTRHHHLQDLLCLLSQPAVNLGLWLQERAAELVQDSAWQLVTESGFRRVATQTPSATLASLLGEIQHQTGTPIPARAGRGYLDLDLGGGARVYAVAWSLSYEDNWMLLLILGAIPGKPTPYGLRWRIADETGLLVEEALLPQRANNYLFAQVVGAYEEKFLVTLTDAHGATTTLPPFEFYLG